MAARKPAYQGRHQADKLGDTKVMPTVKPDAEGKPGTGPTSTRRRKPQHAAETPAPRKRAGATAPEGPSARERRAHAITEEARDYARRSAYRATTGKPSITGRAVAGAAAGTAAGAAVGGPVGAAVGGTVGGIGGGLAGRSAKKAYKVASSTNGAARKIIVIEFLVCMVVAALSPLTDRKREEPPGAWMKRMTAIMGLFFILGLISAAGRGPSKFAAGFGGLVTVALAISNRDLFMKIGSVFKTGDNPGYVDTELVAPELIEPGQGRDRPPAGA